MEFVLSDNKGCVEIQRRYKTEYVFFRNPGEGNVVHAGSNENGVIKTSLLLPFTVYVMCTHEEYKQAFTLSATPPRATPAPARTEASGADVRASGGAVQGCKAVNTGDGLGTIVCAVHGAGYMEVLVCALNTPKERNAQFERDVAAYSKMRIPADGRVTHSELAVPPVAQVGGAHYQQQPGRVQHWDYAAGLLYCEGQVSRYLDRHGKPGGYGAKDVLKALSYLLKILEVQYHDRWSEHEAMLKDLQARLADAYKAECAVPKRETVSAARRANQCMNGNCTKDAALGGPYCVDCTVDFS